MFSLGVYGWYVCMLLKLCVAWYDMVRHGTICYIWYIRYDTYDTWVLIFWNASQLFGFRTRLSVNREKLPRTNSTLFVRKTIQNWYRLNYPTHGVAAVSLITKRLGLSHSVWCHSLVHNVCRTVQICWHYYSVSACVTYATWCACLIQCWGVYRVNGIDCFRFVVVQGERTGRFATLSKQAW